MKIRNKLTQILSLFSLSFLITSIGQLYTLKDSEAYGTWKSEYAKYNCYAFAINRTEIPSEFDTLKQYQPGDFSDQQISATTSIYTIANVVKDDLEVLSYANVNISTTLKSGYDYTIVVRNGSSDYHFMKLSNGSWYHKPGLTQVLKYKYSPSNSRIWTSEHIDQYGTAHPGTTTYDSNIYFISYDDPHEHDFSFSFTWIDKKSHYAFCECGFKTKSGHFVTGSPNSQGEYTCLMCGGVAEMGFVVGPTSKTYQYDKTFVSQNGVLYLSSNDYDKLINNEFIIPSNYIEAWEVI